MINDKPLVLVVGATGAQGGGVVDALLRQGSFAVRGLTRDKDSENAEKLAQKGVEIVQGDLSDEESLIQAMSGAYAVFCVTDYHGTGRSFGVEVQQGKNAIDAAIKVGIQHYVWSALEEVRNVPGLQERLKETSPGHWVPHFESKGEITEYLRGSGLHWTALLTSMYYENFAGRYPFHRQADGTYAMYCNIPSDVPISAHEVADIGETVAAVLLDPRKYIGELVPVVSDVVSFTSIAAAISEATGKTLRFVPITTEEAAGSGTPAAADRANMFAYCALFPNCNELRPRSKTVIKGRTFKNWALARQDQLSASFK